MPYEDASVKNAKLQYVADNGNKLVLCSQEPTTYTEANTTYKLAEVTLDSGDYTLAAGDTSGRKLTLAAQTVTGTATGTATHWAIVKTTATTALLEANALASSVAITNAATKEVNAFDVIEDRAPVSE